MKIKSNIRAGIIIPNHSQTVKVLRVKSKVKAGIIVINHNQAVAQGLTPKAKPVAARRRPRRHAGRELESLLAPYTPATFLDEYWGQKPLFIKGDADKLRRLFGGPFTRADFTAAVLRASEQQAKDFRLRACNPHGLEPGGGGPTSRRIRPDEIEAVFAGGANVAAENIADERLARFVAALKAQMGHFGEAGVTASMSPAGLGWPPHFDRTSVVFIQCEGRKRYLLSPAPVFPYPRSSASLDGDRITTYEHDAEPWEEVYDIDTGSFTEVTMEPGDILILPAGTIHGTQAVGEQSLNVNLIFYHPSFLSLLASALEDVLVSDPAWRHVPAPRASSLSGAGRGELPEDTAEFFARRLGELRRALDRLTPESLALNRAWQKSLSDPGESTLSFIPQPGRACAAAPRPIARKDLLCLSSRSPVTCAAGLDEDGEPNFYMYCSSKEVSVAGEWVPFLRTLAGQSSFRAEAATRWAGAGRRYPWKVVREYLQVLHDHGFIERAA